jgi:hypothetical protein
MNRYVIREVIPWEGWNQWTVFAENEELAKALVRMERDYCSHSLSVQSRRSAKGRKDAGIHKRTSNFEL